jgi:hypothetical protein
VDIVMTENRQGRQACQLVPRGIDPRPDLAA